MAGVRRKEADLEDTLAEFLRVQRVQFCYGTWQQRQSLCWRFLEFAKEYDFKRWSQIGPQQIALYLRERKRFFHLPDGRSPKWTTLRNDTSHLRVLLRFAYRRSWTLGSLSESVESVSKREPLPRSLSVEEVKRWFSLCDLTKPTELRDRALFELAYGTGLRLSELLSLDLCQVDLKCGWVRVEKSKNRRGRLVPLPRKTGLFLQTYLTVRAMDFPSTQESMEALWLSTRGTRLAKPSVDCRVRDLYRERYRQRYKDGAEKLTMHALRHSFATHLLQGGVNVSSLQVLLGHQSIESTEVYTKVDITDLRIALEKAKRKASF